jgi:hypothetical protein
VTVFGSARTKRGDPMYRKAEGLGRLLAENGYAVITGGGPGIMEAANKGALDAGAKSIGLNIELPEEQVCNEYTNMSVTFHHFFVRKVMLVKYALAFVIMPGGLGTLDELTEVLTLMQTHKIKPFPVILFSSAYWKVLLDWLQRYTLAKGYISPEDLDLLRVCDTPKEVVEIVRSWYRKQEIVGKKALGEWLINVF